MDFSKGIINENLSGFFTDSGILGMLEASDLDRIDEVSPFLGAIIDRCCGETKNAPVTTVFTLYVNLLNEIHCRGRTPGWTDEDLGRLDRSIRDFKTIGKSVFHRYQKSGMGTSKWHLLDHLCVDFRRTGGICYMSGGLYEMTHKFVKADYEKTSKRNSSAMSETMRRQEERILQISNVTNKSMGINSIRGPNNTIIKLNPSRANAIRGDAAFLVRSGISITLPDLEKLY